MSGNQVTVAIGTEAEILQAPERHPDGDPEAMLATLENNEKTMCVGANPNLRRWGALIVCQTKEVIGSCPYNYLCP